MIKSLFHQKCRWFFMRITRADIFLSSVLITLGDGVDVFGQDLLDRKLTLIAANDRRQNVIPAFSVTGTVKSEAGEPISGVNVLGKGANKRSATDGNVK